MERYKQQFKKGILEMLVLKLISQKRTYGYELIVQLKNDSHDMINLKEGTLYPILYRLEDEEFILSAHERVKEGGREKKYYVITEKGYELVTSLLDYWSEFSRCVDAIMQITEE